MQLFALPFAGGDAWCYRELSSSLSDEVRLLTSELPGRGRRSDEPLLTDLRRAVDDVLPEIARRNESPFAILGHSMGALIAFELVRRLQASGLNLPSRLFVSGRCAPGLDRDKVRWNLPNDQFATILRALGCSDDVLNSDELMEIFEPILRADFRLVDEYVYRPGRALDVPITVMVGDRDDVSENEARQWQLQTSHPIEVVWFSGGHFFLSECAAEVSTFIATRLAFGSPPLSDTHLREDRDE